MRKKYIPRGPYANVIGFNPEPLDNLLLCKESTLVAAMYTVSPLCDRDSCDVTIPFIRNYMKKLSIKTGREYLELLKMYEGYYPGVSDEEWRQVRCAMRANFNSEVDKPLAILNLEHIRKYTGKVSLVDIDCLLTYFDIVSPYKLTYDLVKELGFEDELTEDDKFVKKWNEFCVIFPQASHAKLEVDKLDSVFMKVYCHLKEKTEVLYD